MDTRYYMVIIKGEIKTSEVISCVYDRMIRKWDVKFNNGRVYSYAYENVEKITNPTVLNTNMYRIGRAGRMFLILRLFMCLKLRINLIGIFALKMEVKETIVKLIYRLLSRVLIKSRLQMYLRT